MRRRRGRSRTERERKRGVTRATASATALSDGHCMRTWERINEDESKPNRIRFIVGARGELSMCSARKC